ncbi:MAG: hypothetical protein R2695_07265 [Acidimicrobiales bacterium]
MTIAIAVGVMWIARDPLLAEPPATRIGSAGVVLRDDTARAVERVTYRQDVVRLGDIVIAAGQPRDEPTGVLAEVWTIVDEMWPTALRDQLVQVSVVREEPRSLVGVVHPASAGGWILSLDAADLDDRPLIEETIVHELSHVVTLAPEVFTFGPVEECDGVRIELGCAAAGSVLAEFATRFWPGDDGGARPGDFVDHSRRPRPTRIWRRPSRRGCWTGPSTARSSSGR